LSVHFPADWYISRARVSRMAAGR